MQNAEAWQGRNKMQSHEMRIEVCHNARRLLDCVLSGRLPAALVPKATQVMAAKLSPASLRLSLDNWTLLIVLLCIFWAAGGLGRMLYFWKAQRYQDMTYTLSLLTKKG